MKKYNKFIRVMLKDLENSLYTYRLLNDCELDRTSGKWYLSNEFDKWYKNTLETTYKLDAYRLSNLKSQVIGVFICL